VVYGGENAPPSWARLPGARCRAVEHLTKLEGLQEFEFLAGLEEGLFQALAIASEVLEIGGGTALYREGEPSGAVYFVREGRVKLYRVSGGPKARDQILGVVGDGSVVGLASALEGKPQSQGASALTDCVLYAVFPDFSGPDPGAGGPRRRPRLSQRPPEGGTDAPRPRYRRGEGYKKGCSLSAVFEQAGDGRGYRYLP
jgi:hypothetical protein